MVRFSEKANTHQILRQQCRGILTSHVSAGSIENTTRMKEVRSNDLLSMVLKFSFVWSFFAP